LPVSLKATIGVLLRWRWPTDFSTRHNSEYAANIHIWVC